jgi:hypothetical protein
MLSRKVYVVVVRVVLARGAQVPVLVMSSSALEPWFAPVPKVQSPPALRTDTELTELTARRWPSDLSLRGIATVGVEVGEERGEAGPLD